MSQELYNAGISKETFRNFMNEINGTFRKWNLDNFKGSEIMYIDPLGRGSLTPEEQSEIETILKSNIGCLTGNFIKSDELYVQKDNENTPDSEKHYTTYENENGLNLRLEENWIFVTRDTTMNMGGFSSTSIDSEKRVKNSIISIKYVYKPVIAHERSHSLIGGGHSISIKKPLSNLEYSTTLPNEPGIADCEAGYVLYDKTHNPGEAYEKVLGEPHNFETTSEKVIDNINNP
jgi:hypothetical protein